MKHALIDLVFTTPAIWDKRHKQHHHRYILGREWERIAAKVGMAATEARTCWKNLRQEFGKQLKKSENVSGNAAVDDMGIHWPYFSKLLFLQDQFPPRVTSSNSTDKLDESSTLSATNTVDSDSENSDHSEQGNCTPFTRLSTSNTTRPSPDLDHTSQPPTPIDPLTPSSSTFHITKTGCKRQITPQNEVDLEKEKPKKNKTSYDSRDEDIGFFNSLLPYVKSLSPKDKFIFRMKVQQTLFELAFPEQQSDHRGTSFTSPQSTNRCYPKLSDQQLETQMSDWNENVEMKFTDLQECGCKHYNSS